MRPEHGDLTIHGVGSYAEVVDPDEYNESADADQILRNAELAARRFPIMEHGLALGGYAGVYDTTPDKRPLVGEHQNLPGFYALNGWSGRGMLLAPYAAELLAREIAGRGRDPLLTGFGPDRFAGHAAVVSATGDYYSGYAHQERR